MSNTQIIPTETDQQTLVVNELPPKVYDVNRAMELAGTNDKYQKKLIILYSLQRICLGFLFTSFPFLFANPEYQCRQFQEDDYFACQPNPENCQFDIVPTPDSGNSIIKYFGLYCDKAHYATVAQMAFTATCSLGILVFGPKADKEGRRASLMQSYILGAGAMLVAGLTSNLFILIVMFAIVGLTMSPFSTYSLVHFNEAADEKLRNTGNVAINAIWTFGEMGVGIMAYLVNNHWRHITLVGLGIPFALLIPMMARYVIESPMFLVANNRFEEARIALKRIAQVNNNRLDDFKFDKERKAQRQFDKQPKSYGYFDLFKYNSLRMITIMSSILSFFLFFIYFGTIFAISNISFNPYLLTIILAWAELFAYIMAGIMVQKLTRRQAFAFCFVLCGAANISFLFFPVPDSCKANPDQVCFEIFMQVVCAIVNRFGISIVMMIIGIYTTEVFPTPVRAVGSGFATFVGRIGAFIATIAISFAISMNINPILIFGFSCIPAAFIAISIKETKGLPLPDYIDEEAPGFVDKKKTKSYVKGNKIKTNSKTKKGASSIRKTAKVNYRSIPQKGTKRE